jgi:OOP family OmpA-OmpF porin
MKTFTAAAALLSLGIFPALAQSAPMPDNPSGPYVGAGWGQFNLDIHTIEDVTDATSDIVGSDDNAWKVFTGWRFNPYFAVEVAYIDFGATSGRFDGSGSSGNYELDLSGFAPYVVASVPLGPVELFAKVGTYFYDVNIQVDLDNPGPDVDSSHSGTDLLYGGGLGITILEHIALRAEYEAVKVEDADSSDAIWLSAAWRF